MPTDSLPIDAMPLGVLVADHAGRYVHANPAACAMLGYDRRALVGRHIGEFIDPAHRATVMDFLAVLDRKGTATSVGSTICGDRVERAFRFDGLRTDEGYVAFLTDVDAQAAGQAELRESEHRLRAIFNHHFHLTALLDPSGRILAVNEAALRLGGVSEAEVIGTSFWEGPWWRHSEALQAQVRQAIARANEGEVTRFEASHIGPDGETHFIDFSLTPVRDPAGGVVYLVPEGRDVTERRLTQELLQRRAQQQAAVAAIGLLALGGADLDALVDEAARRIAVTLGIDFVGMLERLGSNQRFLVRGSYGWPDLPLGRLITDSADSMAAHTLAIGKPVIAEDVLNDPRFVAAPLLRTHGVTSGVTVIVSGRTEPVGVLGVLSTARRQFSEDDVHFIQSVANILAEGIRRTQVDEELREGLAWETFSAEILTGVLATQPEQLDRQVAVGLQRLGEFIGIDRVRLIDVFSDVAEHRDLSWQRPGAGPVPSLSDRQEVRTLLPYVYEQLLQNCVVRTATVDDLPGDALVDRASYAAFNVVSSLILPCLVEGRLSGILFVSSTQKAHAWSDEEVRQCRSLATVFATALARRHAHEALHESRRRLATLLNNLQGMAYRCLNDAFRTMEFASDGCRELTGYDTDELLHNRVMSHESLIHREDALPVRQAVDAALARRTAFAIEYRLVAKTGQVRWVMEKGQGVFGPDGELDAIEGFITDISERRAAEEALQRTQAELLQAQKMEAIGRLAGGVAHDFNNLLSVILGYSEDVMEHLAEHDPRRRELAQVVKAADAATSLTRQLLAFSRKQVVEPKLVRLGGLVAGTQKMLGRLIGEDVALTVEGAGLAACVKVDPGQMEQVILNLAVNARDAMPGGGRLTLRVDSLVAERPVEERTGTVPAGRYVLVAVADTGCGMDAETQAHLFEPFFSTKELGKGTGLGLATVYGIVRQAGGYIGFDSAPGEGTRFRVYLPEADLPPAGAEEAAMPMDVGAQGESLLVVEDDPSLRRLMQEILVDAGYRVLAAGNGAAAAEFAATFQEPIHLLVTDVVMPEMNGRQLAEHVMALRPETKTLFVSGYTDDILGYHGVLAPGVRLLNKPFTRIQLLQAVRVALESHRTPL